MRRKRWPWLVFSMGFAACATGPETREATRSTTPEAASAVAAPCRVDASTVACTSLRPGAFSARQRAWVARAFPSTEWATIAGVVELSACTVERDGELFTVRRAELDAPVDVDQRNEFVQALPFRAGGRDEARLRVEGRRVEATQRHGFDLLGAVRERTCIELAPEDDALVVRTWSREGEAGWRRRADRRLAWMQIEAQLDDAAIERRALLRRAEQRRYVPLDRVVRTDRHALDDQIEARSRAIGAADSTEARAALLRERAELLEALFDLEEDARVAELGVASWLELGADERARALARRAFGYAPDSPRLRDLLFATARAGGLASLASLLEELRPELASRERSTLAARALEEASSGMEWGVVESSFDNAGRPPRPTRTLRRPVPLGSLGLGVDTLIELGTLVLRSEGAEGNLEVRVDGALRDEAASEVLGLGMRWSRGRTVWASGALPARLITARRLGAAVRDQIAAGRQHIEVAVGARRVVFEVSRDVLVAMDAEHEATPWGALLGAVGPGLRDLVESVFPPPSIALELDDVRRDSLAARASEWRIECSRLTGALVCTSQRGVAPLEPLLVEAVRLLTATH